MSALPLVGEAVILVRVLSNKLANDIRDAVKRSFNDANADIDAEGKKAGQRLNDSMASTVKKDMERTVGKEVVLATRRLAITSGRETDLLGRELGNRFVVSTAQGIRDNDSIIGRQLSSSMVRQFTSNDSSGRIGERIGGNLMQQIGRGLEENGDSGIGAPFRRTIVRELESGSRGALVRASDVDSNLFMRNFVAGLRNGEANVNDQLRRTFANTVRDQESDLTNGFRRVFVSGIRGATPDITSAFHSTLRDGVQNGVRDAEPNLRTRLRGLGSRLNDSLSNEFQRLGFFRFGNGWADDLRGAFNKIRSRNVGRNAGEDTADDVDSGLRRGMNRNRTKLGTLFQGIGEDLFKHFNLGFGAARMGAAIISVIATAAPSIISGLGAIITAVIGDLVNLAAALGPGIAGGIGVGIAAISTLGLNLGLLMLAFKGNTQQAKDFKAQLASFKETLTGSFAPGVLSGFSDLIAKLKDSLLPAINDLLVKTGTAMGEVARHIGDVVTSGDNLRRIQGILSTNIDFLGNFKDGLGGLVSSFLTLFNAAKPFVDYIGLGIKHFGEWAASSLAVSEANGNLATWMDGMLASFKDLLGIIKDFGAGIGNIFSAAAGPGASLLDSIRGIADRFHAWTDDTGNMAKMTQFFTNARTLASKVYEVLGNIFTAGGQAFTNMDLGPILHVLDTLQNVVAPAVARLFNQIQAGASDNLVRAFDNIGTALGKIADSGNFEKVANLIGTIIEKLTEFAASDIGSTILSVILPFALMGGILTSLVGPLATVAKGLFGLAEAAGLISAPILAIVAVAAAIAGAFALIYANSESFRQSLSDLAGVIGGAFTQVWTVIGPKLEEVWGKVQKLASAIGDRLAPVIAFLTPIIADAIRFIGELFANILDAVGGFIDIITGILTGNWQLIWQGVVEVLGAAWDQIKTIFAIGLAAISAVWDTITAVVYNAGQVLYGIVSTVWQGIWSVIQTVAGAIWSFLQAGWTLAVELIGTLLQGLVAVMSAIWATISGEVVSAWNAIYAFFETIFNAITGAITSFGNAIPPFLAGVWQFVQDTAINVWNAIYAFFEGIFNTITGAITSFGNAIPPFLAGIWETIKGAASAAWGAISGIATALWGAVVRAITSVVDPIVGTLQGIWDSITSAVSSAWDGVAGVVSGIWEGIKSAITGPVEAALGVVQDVVGTITGVIQGALDFISRLTAAITSIPEAPTGGLVTANPIAPPSILGPEGIGGGIQRMMMRHLMEIPGLATGGIVPATPGGQLFRLGEGGRSERVDPIGQDGMTQRDWSLIRALTKMSNNGDISIQVQIGDRPLDAFVTGVVRREQSDLARRVGKVKR